MAKDTGIVNIHGKEYTTVARRVQSFREDEAKLDHDTPTDIMYRFGIVTELVERTETDVVMKATIQTIEGQVLATGYAEEKRNASMINKTSALENCETSAIGRALAAFGLAGSEYASADEVASAITQQNTPQTVSAPAKRDFTKPSIAQLRKIRELAGEVGVAPEATEARLAEIKTSLEASKAIKDLERIKDESEHRDES